VVGEGSLAPSRELTRLCKKPSCEVDDREERQTCVLLTDGINQIGDPSAIHGFCPDGRHDVE
jgi:hypothetical protein